MRVLVDAKVHDALVEKLVPLVRALPYGNPADPKTVVGPLVTRKAVDGVFAKIERVKAARARMLVGGPAQGRVVPPHLFVDVDPTHALARQEVFRPVLPVMRFRTDDEAMATDTEYGMAGAVFSPDVARAQRFAMGLDAAMTNINDQTRQTDIYGPFGGEKNSGFGRVNGEWIIEEFTRPHWVTQQDIRRAHLF
ncbi:MAG: aldehyde dehydrogenase family protein [Nitrospira sp.]|nr:aldehyde dehydrogenase family protein [Nitrospira sp.]